MICVAPLQFKFPAGGGFQWIPLTSGLVALSGAITTIPNISIPVGAQIVGIESQFEESIAGVAATGLSVNLTWTGGLSSLDPINYVASGDGNVSATGSWKSMFFSASNIVTGSSAGLEAVIAGAGDITPSQGKIRVNALYLKASGGW